MGRVFRVGETVRRPASAQTPAIAEFLLHLESAGFDGSPRSLGLDERGREILSYIDGDSVPTPIPGWAVTEDALVSIAELIRRFHAASRSFVPSAGASFLKIARPGFEGSVVCHNDLSPNNVIFKDGRAVGMIDFDAAGPVDPLWDVMVAASHWTPILHPDHLPSSVAPEQLPRRLRLFCDTYGVARGDRPRILRGIHYFLNRGLRAARWRHQQGVPGFVKLWEEGHGERLASAKTWFAQRKDDFLETMR